MTTVHLDMESGRQTAEQLKIFRETVREQISTLSAYINDQFIDVEWKGQSAEAFRSEFNDWVNYKLVPQLNALESLETALRNHLENWNDTTSTFIP